MHWSGWERSPGVEMFRTKTLLEMRHSQCALPSACGRCELSCCSHHLLLCLPSTGMAPSPLEL